MMVKKATYLLVGTILTYAILVATHQGEFWPFSIYPMFSQADIPWSHSLVREVSDDVKFLNWSATSKEKLPGKPFALNAVGINQNDLANFIQKNKKWSHKRVQALRKYFKRKLDKQSFLIFKVEGKFSNHHEDAVVITYTPYIFITKDTTIINPRIL